MKLHQGKFTLDVRKTLFTRVSKLAREVVMAPSLSVFKKHLDSQCSWICGLTFKLFCVESGAGLGPSGSLSTQDILFCGFMMYKQSFFFKK